MDEKPWYKNWKVITAAVAALLVLGILGALSNKVKTLETSRTELITERDQLLQVSRTAEARIRSILEEKRTAESRYRNLRAAKNLITGGPMFDQAGQVIFETEEGSASELTNIRQDLEEMRKENELLSDQVSMRQRELAEVRKETSRPAQSAWDFGLGYSAPVASWLNYARGTGWAGTAYHVKLLTLDIGINGHLGWTPAARPEDSIAGKLYINFRP